MISNFEYKWPPGLPIHRFLTPIHRFLTNLLSFAESVFVSIKEKLASRYANTMGFITLSGTSDKYPIDELFVEPNFEMQSKKNTGF